MEIFTIFNIVFANFLHTSDTTASSVSLGLRNEDELISPSMHHSFRPSLPDLKVEKY